MVRRTELAAPRQSAVIAAVMGVLFASIPALSGPANGPSICDEVARESLDELILRRAILIEPRRRDSPLRYLNISDEEVREIQSVAAEVVGKVLLTIGPVVVGCSCEDGSNCTGQVWILAHLPNDTVGLLLSKIEGHWNIGKVQRWWLRDADLRIREHCSSTTECDAFTRAWRDHMDDFPQCGLKKKEMAYISEAALRCNRKRR